jgi:hypothetical protein
MQILEQGVIFVPSSTVCLRLVKPPETKTDVIFTRLNNAIVEKSVDETEEERGEESYASI